MRLILTRHGETEENKLGIMQGHLHGRLSEEGINQAKKLALRLKDEKIDFIFSSDLARVADTAKEIAKFHLDAPLKFVEDLRERNLGEFQGMKKSDFGWDRKTLKSAHIQPKEGETIEQLYNRAKNFLNKVFLEHKKDTVLFVGHNGINTSLVAVLTGKGYEDVGAIEGQLNTAVSIFEIEEGNNKMILFNDVGHLSKITENNNS